MSEAIDWRRAAPHPVALVLLPWEGGGVTIAKRDATGALYGCRDVTLTAGREAEFCSCVAAWISTERRKLRIEDRANAVNTIRAYARRLTKSVRALK